MTGVTDGARVPPSTLPAPSGFKARRNGESERHRGPDAPGCGGQHSRPAQGRGMRPEEIGPISRLLNKGVHVRNRRVKSLMPGSCWRKLSRSHGTFSPFGFADRPSWGHGA